MPHGDPRVEKIQEIIKREKDGAGRHTVLSSFVDLHLCIYRRVSSRLNRQKPAEKALADANEEFIDSFIAAYVAFVAGALESSNAWLFVLLRAKDRPKDFVGGIPRIVSQHVLVDLRRAIANNPVDLRGFSSVMNDIRLCLKGRGREEAYESFNRLIYEFMVDAFLVSGPIGIGVAQAARYWVFFLGIQDRKKKSSGASIGQ